MAQIGKTPQPSWWDPTRVGWKSSDEEIYTAIAQINKTKRSLVLYLRQANSNGTKDLTKVGPAHKRRLNHPT